MNRQLSILLLFLIGMLDLTVSAFDLKVETIPTGAGSAGGGGSYEEGSEVWVTTSPNTGFAFLGWYDGSDRLSLDRRFKYIMPSRDVTLTARYEFSPDSPSDPAMPDTATYYAFRAKVVPEGAGGVNISSDRYPEGKNVSLSASANTGFVFRGWYDGDDLLSQSRSYTYTMPGRNVELTARYDFDPQSPSNPDAPVVKYPLTITRSPEYGGSVSPASGSRYAPGEKVNLSASTNSGFVFDGWADDEGTLLSTSRNRTVTMPDGPLTLTALFRFSPESPGNPSEPVPTRNILYASRSTAYPGGNMIFDVGLENVDRVKGMEVVITLPAGPAFNLEGAVPAPRAAMHTLSVEPLAGEREWRIILRGDEMIEGANGALVRIPVNIPKDASPGTVYEILLDGGKIYLDNGSELPVDGMTGRIKVAQLPDELPDSPDFRIESVTAEEAEVMPGDVVTFGWTVTNAGSIDATGGWSEALFLSDSDGKRVSLGTVFYDGAGIAAGQSVSRSATLAIPRIPGISGKLAPGVTVLPYLASDEIIELQANNTTIGEGFPITLGKRLILTLPEVVTEGEDAEVSGMLARTGRWDESETFSLAAVDADPRLNVPATVIIPHGQSAAWFRAPLSGNMTADPESIVRITASGNDYEAAAASITIRDSQLPAITLSLSPDEAAEGAEVDLKAEIPFPSASDLTLNLTAVPSDRVTLPGQIVIPAGSTKASVKITASDNNAVDGHVEVAVNASAAGFDTATAYLTVFDDEMPELSMQLSPSEVNENAGAAAVKGEIRRITNLDKRVTLRLTAYGQDQLMFPVDRIVMEPGVATAEFTVAVIDNNIVDGDRDVELTASVYIPSCNCTASGGPAGSVSGVIRIIDNDCASLALSSSRSVVAEGDRSGVELTLSRNAGLDKSLTVDLSSDTPDAFDMPTSVVIRKGESQVSFKITAPVNDVVDDDRTVVIAAQAEGYAPSKLWMMITDRTLPDARITAIDASAREVVAGGKVDVTIKLASTGVMPLPAQTCVAVYADGEIAGRVWIQDALAPGVVKELHCPVTLPDRGGVCEVYAEVNHDRTFKEISYSDNRSERIRVRLISPFRAGVALSTDRIARGDSLTISGHLEGSDLEGREVEIYIVNAGVRSVLKTEAAADGSFAAVYAPYASQTGHFSVGACYPGEALTDEMASFEIPDIKRLGSGFLTCEGVPGTGMNLSIDILNPCGIPMTGVKAKVAGVPSGVDAEVRAVGSIAPGARAAVDLCLTGKRPTTGNDWERMSIEISSEEGAVLDVPVYWFCRSASGELVSSVTHIEADLPEDTAVEYPVKITNRGAGATGALDVVLPEWMKCAGPLRLPSLDPGEETTLTLLLRPSSSMSLNHNVSGQLAVNCENGKGAVISYKVMPVSNSTAWIRVDACDEYTYSTPAAPKVKDAKVTVVNPGNGLTVAEGATDGSGSFTAELPAGYYRVDVTADKHDSWSGTVFLNPGKTKTVTANISFNPITISYTVVPTEVEDEYLIETTAKFEVNVPAPVVHIIAPSRIDGDDMEVGQATIINVSMVNEGLMTAFNVNPLFEKNNPEWSFEPLDHAGPFDLAPHQVVDIPVRITRKADISESRTARAVRKGPAEDMYRSYGGCMSHVAATYEVMCGDTIWKNAPAASMAMKMCAAAATMAGVYSALSDLYGGGSGGPGGPGGGSGNGGGASTSEQPVGGEVKFSICDPCDAAKGEALIDQFAGMYGGGIGMFWSKLAQIVKLYISEGRRVKVVVEEVSKDMISTGMDMKMDHGGDLVGLVATIYEVAKPCEEEPAKSPARHAKKVAEEDSAAYFDESAPEFNHSWQKVFYDESKQFCDGWDALVEIFTMIMGDPVWLLDPTDDKIEYMEYVANLEPGTVVEDEEVALHKPESVTFVQARNYIDRVLGVVDVASLFETELSGAIDTFMDVDEKATKAGYDSGADRFLKAYASYQQEFEKLKSDAVCASVTLRFSQTMTMTREAFRGSLEVFNGHDDTPMRDVRLNLTVEDTDGNIATAHEFQITPETLRGFEGTLDLLSGWQLAAGERGVAEILFIPTRYAAPQSAVVWNFGGTITYIDPFTGEEVTRRLLPVSITVNPTPVLDLTYFLQRDVYSDDPLTAEVVEESEGAEFALVIRNSGAGDARNVKLVTRQPQIVDNEKGILIDTEFTSSQLNGADRHLSLGGSMTSDFGDIPAGSSAYAQWWFESSIAGHFIDYDVEATHVTSHDNPDLSLLGNVEIHELIRGITDPSDASAVPRRLFLANDIADSDDSPDMVYFSDSSAPECMDGAILSTELMDRNSYKLHVQPVKPGWVYGSIADPTGGRMRLIGLVRLSDGAVIPVDNCWQTSMTMRDGAKPLHENRLHIAVNASGTESYKLIFEKRPAGVLQVDAIAGVPSEIADEIDPVKNVTVSFTKEVDAESFTTDALRLTLSGEHVDLSDVKIDKLAPTDYDIDFGSATLCRGYYVLTVDASSLKDAEGYPGKDGKSIAWLQKGEEVQGVGSISSDRGVFEISPVPVRGRMTVTGSFNHIDRLCVYDCSGRLVAQWDDLNPDVASAGGRNSVSLSVDHAATGLMVVTALTDGGVIHTRRVVFIAE